MTDKRQMPPTSSAKSRRRIWICIILISLLGAITQNIKNKGTHTSWLGRASMDLPKANYAWPI